MSPYSYCKLTYRKMNSSDCGKRNLEEEVGDYFPSGRNPCPCQNCAPWMVDSGDWRLSWIVWQCIIYGERWSVLQNDWALISPDYISRNSHELLNGISYLALYRYECKGVPHWMGRVCKTSEQSWQFQNMIKHH